jgi:hypothetical protein
MPLACRLALLAALLTAIPLPSTEADLPWIGHQDMEAVKLAAQSARRSIAPEDFSTFGQSRPMARPQLDRIATAHP